MIYFLGLLVSLFYSVSAFGSGFKESGFVEFNWKLPSSLEAAIYRAGDGLIVSATISKFLFASPNTFMAVRFGLDGTRDLSFGRGGELSLPLKGQSLYLRTRSALSGKLLFLGVTRAGMTEDFDITLLRTSANGITDTSFGQGGVARIDFDFGTEDQPIDVISLPGDELLLVFQSTDQTVVRSLVLKLNANGEIDPFFGKNGAIDIPVPRGASLSSVFMGPNGTLVVFGSTPSGGQFSARFFLDGKLDPAYGKGGLAEHKFFPEGTSRVSQIAAVPSGGYLFLGINALNQKDTAFLARLDEQGLLDATFGKSGLVAAADEKDKINSLQTLQPVPGGGFLGMGRFPKESLITFVKFGADGALDATFGSGGAVSEKIADQGFVSPITLVSDGSDWIFEATLSPPKAGVLLGRLDAKGALLGVKAGSAP